MAESLRKNFKLGDSNMFVTSFVLYGLLEAQQLGTMEIDEHKFSESLMAMTGFKDKNVKDGIHSTIFGSRAKSMEHGLAALLI